MTNAEIVKRLEAIADACDGWADTAYDLAHDLIRDLTPADPKEPNR